MHALQDLGEALVALDPKRLAELAAEVALPERLVDAIVAGPRHHRLGRPQAAAPVRRQADARRRSRADPRSGSTRGRTGQAIDAARQHALERWRDRLLAEPDALDPLAAEHPQLDRPRFRALIARARAERERGAPPHAYRELFRELKALSIRRLESLRRRDATGRSAPKSPRPPRPATRTGSDPGYRYRSDPNFPMTSTRC